MRTAPVTQEQRYLPSFLGLSTALLCITDVAGVVVWTNRSFERVLGYRPKGLIGMSLDEILHPDDVAASDSAREVLRSGADVTGVQLRYRCRNESWRTFQWTMRAEPARHLVYASAHDVTDRRRAEDGLRESEARLRAIMQHSPSAIFVKDLDSRYLVANEEWSRLTGIGVSDIVGNSVSETWTVNAAAIVAHERALLADGTSRLTDEQMVTGDGKRDFIVNRFLLRDEDGEPYAIGGIATDITERKKAQAALATRDRVLDTVLKASPDIITLMDRHGRIHQVSEAERAILGWQHEDGSPPDIFTKVHPDDLEIVGAAFVRMVSGGVHGIHLRYRVQHADGRWITVDSRGQAVLDHLGHFAGAVVVSRDITAALEFEKRLEAAREAAEKASGAKSDFLSRMSHELRTPLNSILGFSQLLQMDDLPVLHADGVDHILRAGKHLLDLIDEVLDIARIESGYLELAMVPVALAELVSDAVALTRPIAERAEVAVRVSIEPRSSVAVLADRQRLLQVLLNLLSNAVKYNRPGGHIDVSCEAIDRGRLRLAVADTGRGIRPGDLERVFEPFDRLGAEQSGVEGTGVGLALSKQLVERMGGTLGFDSVPEVGSTFFIDLPAASVERADHFGEAKIVTAAAPALSKLFRVLLIEDNLTNLDLVERVLSRRPGVDVLAAMHGGLGLDLAREHVPDLILLDLHLPDMDGTAVLDRLQADDVTTGIPVALVSAEAPGPQVRALLGRGVVGHLLKPLDVRGLLALVDVVRASRGT